VGVASFCDGGGRVGGVSNKLLDAVEADVEAAMQNDGDMGGREGVDVWEVVHPLCVPVLSLDRSAVAAAAVTGGGEALTFSASLARRPLITAAGDGGRLGIGVRGRVLPGLALRVAAGSCCCGWNVAGGCSGG
jgi:hypothetical protein